MDNIILCMNAVLPLLLLIALGYLARSRGFIDTPTVLKMNKLAFNYFMPFIMFNSLYDADLSYAIKPKLIAFAMISVLLIYLLAIAFSLKAVKEKNKQGVVIQGLFRSNYVLIGLPIAASLVPGGEIATVAVLMVLVVAEFNILAVLALSVFNGQRVDAKSTALKIIKNPLLIGAAVGLVFRLLNIHLPEAVKGTADDIAQAGSTLLLVLLGAFFEFDSIGRNKRELFFVCFGRLVAVPAIFLTAGYLMGFRNMDFAALLGAFGSSAAATSFTMAQQMGGDAELAGDIVVLTSALCPVTLFMWSMIFKSLGAF